MAGILPKVVSLIEHLSAASKCSQWQQTVDLEMGSVRTAGGQHQMAKHPIYHRWIIRFFFKLLLLTIHVQTVEASELNLVFNNLNETIFERSRF